MILINIKIIDIKTRELVIKLFKPNNDKTNLVYFLANKDDINHIKIQQNDDYYIFTYPFLLNNINTLTNESKEQIIYKEIKCKKIFIICCNGNDDIPNEMEDITELIIKKKFKKVYEFNEWNLYTKNYLWKWSMIHESITRFMIPEKSIFQWIFGF
jgi:hypothetical protein